MIATPNQLGIGIYTPAEAAFYARVSPRMIARWLFGDSAGNPVIERQLRESDERVVTFLDLIQTLAIREVRLRHRIPLQRIRDAIDKAREKYGLEYPLAHRHRIFLFSDQQGTGHGDILIRLDEGGGDESFVQLTGRGHGNLVLKPIVEMFLDDLSFDPETHLATEYRPMTEGAARIVLNPHRRFGEPIVEPGGYTAATLWHATNTEGSIEDAASAYGVSKAEVELANKYYDMLQSSKAA